MGIFVPMRKGMVLNKTTLATGICGLYCLAVVVVTARHVFWADNSLLPGFEAETAYSSVLYLQVMQLVHWKFFGPVTPDTSRRDLTIVLNWLILLAAMVFLCFFPIHFFRTPEMPAGFSMVRPYYYSSGIAYLVTTLPALKLWQKATRTDPQKTFTWVLVLAVLQALTNAGEYWILLGF